MPAYRGRGTHGQVVELLGRRIVSGELPEGDTLDLPTLGAELDVSLSVLREAIKVLTAKGLVDARQKRGTFIRPRSAWDLLDADVVRWRSGSDDHRLLRDLGEVRGVIEPAAARYAAGRRTERDLQALDTALERMAAATGDPRTAAAADLAFHRALLAATGNEILARLDVFLEQGLLTRDVLVHSLDQDDDPVPSHEAVLRAVREGDPAQAELAMLDLLAKSVADQECVAGSGNGSE